MINMKDETARKMKVLFEFRSFAVLSTQKNHQPYASLIAYAATDDLTGV